MFLLEKLIAVAAPHYCIVCEKEGKLLCGNCTFDLPVVPSRCYKCQAASKDYRTCLKCRHSSVLNKVWVRTMYQDAAQELLRLYKFDRAQAAHFSISDGMTDVLPLIDRHTLLVPVPTATARRRLRGFDHALLLAQRIANTKNLIYLQPLTRLTQARQVGASRKQRYIQMEKAFMVTKGGKVAGKKILLIDDVITTGATLEATAKLLKRAGAKQVDALVFTQRI